MRTDHSCDIEATLHQPLRTLPAQNGRTGSHGVIKRNGKDQLLRVIHEGERVVLVVTVMAASKISKYQGAAP